MRLPAQLRTALERTGLPWSVEHGTRHFKLIVNGRLVGVLPHGKADERDRATKNLVAQVRRASRS